MNFVEGKTSLIYRINGKNVKFRLNAIRVIVLIVIAIVAAFIFEFQRLLALHNANYAFTDKITATSCHPPL